MSEHSEKEISATAVGEAYRQVITHMKVNFVYQYSTSELAGVEIYEVV